MATPAAILNRNVKPATRAFVVRVMRRKHIRQLDPESSISHGGKFAQWDSRLPYPVNDQIPDSWLAEVIQMSEKSLGPCRESRQTAEWARPKHERRVVHASDIIHTGYAPDSGSHHRSGLRLPVAASEMCAGSVYRSIGRRPTAWRPKNHHRRPNRPPNASHTHGRRGSWTLLRASVRRQPQDLGAT